MKILFLLFTALLFQESQRVNSGQLEPLIIRDLPYYDGEEKDKDKHRLDLYLPESSHNAPLIVWIHGGAWASGDRKYEEKVCRSLSAQGVAVAAISYRLSPGLWMHPSLDKGIQHPEHVRDACRSIAFLKKQAARYGYDPHKIIIAGYSAGAVMSAQIALDPTYLAEVGLEIKDLQAAIPIAGGYDLIDYYHSIVKEMGEEKADQHVRAALGNTFEDLKKASPLTYLDNSQIPMLILSESDTYDYTLILEDAVKKNQTPFIQFHHVRDLNHTGLFREMESMTSKYNQLIIDFITSL